MAIYSLYLISKSGSLLYQRDFKTANSPITKQKSNDYLIIASNLHGIHTIAAKLTPNATKLNSNLTNSTSNNDFTNNNSNNNNNNNNNDINEENNDNLQLDREKSEVRSSITSFSNTFNEDGIDPTNNNYNYNNKKGNGGGINVNSNKTGLRCVNTEKFNMFIHQTVTGIKIIILTSTDLKEFQISNFQNTIYKFYSDYVMKNPFYSLDMPIRIKLFDDKILSAVINYNIK